MRKYPKFLKTLPSFYGLAPADLLGLGIGLFISMVFDLEPIVALVLSGLLMGAFKIVRQYFDVVGFLLPSRRELFLRRGDYESTF